MNVLRVVRGIISIVIGGGALFMAFTDDKLKDQKTYYLGIGAVLIFFGLWRIKAAMSSQQQR